MIENGNFIYKLWYFISIMIKSDKKDLNKTQVGFYIDNTSLGIIMEAADLDNRKKTSFFIHAALWYARHVNKLLGNNDTDKIIKKRKELVEKGEISIEDD